MSFHSVGAAPLCYHRSCYEVDPGGRIRTLLLKAPRVKHVKARGRLSLLSSLKEVLKEGAFLDPDR